MTMTQIPRSEEELMALRLPELQALFAKVTGTLSRAPNKRFLARKILETLDVQDVARTQARQDTPNDNAEFSADAFDVDEDEDLEDINENTDDEEAEDEEVEDSAVDADYSGPEWSRKALRAKDALTLRRLYIQVVGRDTKSFDVEYLTWKIREVIKGNVPAGKSTHRGSPRDIQTLPLRLERSTVEQLDAARERLNLKNRMVLFRNALHDYLCAQGETDVAALFTDT